MTPLKEDLVLLIIQFLAEEGLEESRHSLEHESGLFFNVSYFQDSIKRGKWDTAEDYVNGFTHYFQDYDSRMMFDEIRKYKYTEALRKHEIDKAVNILRKELKMMEPNKAEEFEELGMRLAFDHFREDDDIDAARAEASEAIMAFVRSIPDLNDRVEFPDVGRSRLWTLINHSLQWQHYLCKNSEPMPDIESLLVDHVCADRPSSSATEIPPKLRWKKSQKIG